MGVPLPCKPDFVRPAVRGSTVISLIPQCGTPRLRGMRLIPGDLGRAGSPSPVLSCTTRGLPCRLGRPWRGGLLPHHFTLACALLVQGHRRCVFCGTFRPGSSRFPSPACAGRAALWCPDFPQSAFACEPRPSGERQTQPSTARPNCPRKSCNTQDRTAPSDLLFRLRHAIADLALGLCMAESADGSKRRFSARS